MTPAPSPHPDDLRLVAFAENRLLDFEQEGIEAHLVGCSTCRILVAELAEEAAGELQPVGSPQAAVGTRSWGPGPWKVLLAAALLLILARLIPWSSAPAIDTGFELAIASTRQGVFAVQRGAAGASDEFYVGVRLQEAGWVRLIGFDHSGVALEIPLDELGTTSASYEGQAEYVFGPYPMQLGVDQRVHTVAALVSATSIPWPSIEACDWQLDAQPAAWREQATTLAAEVQVMRAEGGH